MWGGAREEATFLCVHTHTHTHTHKSNTKTVYVPPSAKGTQHFETKCLRIWDLTEGNFCSLWGLGEEEATLHYFLLSRDANQKYPDT